MRFTIDVVFLDREGRIVKIAHRMKPLRAALGKGARKVLELNGGAAASAGLEIGDRVVFEDLP
jgi:uncharacterized membrane protein (UPF0127 family)